jgi:hypothetical protein
VRACGKRYYRVAEPLLQRGADSNIIFSSYHHQNPDSEIGTSVEKENISITRLLLSIGATPPELFSVSKVILARNK